MLVDMMGCNNAMEEVGPYLAVPLFLAMMVL